MRLSWSMFPRFLRSMLRIRPERPLASEAARTNRIRVCQSCEYGRTLQCLKCDCFIRLKTMFEHEKCPIGKW